MPSGRKTFLIFLTTLSFADMKKRLPISLIVFSLISITQLLALSINNTPDYKQPVYHLSNLAVSMDGYDNEIRTGIRILKDEWTLEAWVKGDDKSWKEYEVIIGGGEYSELNSCDNMPLVLKEGKLHCKGANISASTVLDDQWHHIAASCDGKQTTLFLDGTIVAQADTAIAILPGAIGSNKKGQTWGGLIDEVRIWDTALSQAILKKWKNKSLEASHLHINNLIAYYPFDDFKDELSINWVGQGHQSYHIRNGRIDFYGSLSKAYTVVNDNPQFIPYKGNQTVFNAVSVNSEWDVDQNAKDCQIIKLRIAVNGNDNPLKLTKVVLDLSENTSLNDISKIHLYQTGKYPNSKERNKLCGTGVYPGRKKTLEINPSENTYLSQGINYFLITFDIDKKAKINNTIHASISSFTLNNKTYIPEKDHDFIKQKVVKNSSEDANILKVLQWNIWHGGVHLGKHQGRERIIDLIQKTNADIITMQEGYGAQDTIASSIGFYLQTNSPKDNLALLSRYPIKQRIISEEPFKSNPAIISLPNNKRILVNDCWLRYSHNPEYTSLYASNGLDPDLWIREDSLLPLVDIKNLISKDIEPYMEEHDMPIIIGGDFNSGSHLDWTEKAKHLHNGYGPVNLPVSQHLVSEGFKDSFREAYPDEVYYQGGTFAVIFGQLQDSRIDYIYYKGKGMKVLASKIIRSSYEIDDVWASDHAAVITVFDTSEK